MNWVVVGLAAAALSAAVNVLDKSIIHHYVRTPLTLPLLSGIVQTTGGLVLLAIVRVPAGAPGDAVAWAVGSGVALGLAAQFLMRGLFTGEVSRVVPVFQSYPLFTALLAVLFLGETLGALQWLAIAATVAGAGMLSLRGGAVRGGLVLQRSFYLLMVGAFLAGASHLMGKAAVDHLPVLTTHALRMSVLGMVFLIFSVRPGPIADLRVMLAARSPGLALVALNETVIASVGLLATLWALSLGPASLVTALTGTRSMWVVVYSTGAALIWRGFLGESTTRGAVALKVGATGLTVAGITGIALL
jgi:drug/metabolite transporter (DMT)-like permease